MRLKNFIDGLLILQPYYHGGDGYYIGAGHDEFFAYQTDKPLTPEDVQKMRDLGWMQPDTDEGEEYNPEDGWSAFT